MITPGKLEWDIERVQRFWNYEALRTNQRSYFTQEFGVGIVNFLNGFAPIESKKLLDYGAGPGHLLAHLEQRGAFYGAADFSSDSVAVLEKRFGHSPHWLGGKTCNGAILPFPDECFDVVLCVETIEHILEEYLTPTFLEIRRVLVPNGIALFTTPSNEKLDESMIYCPNCNMEFHRWQHLRNWTADGLRSVLEKNGFHTLFCDSIHFRGFISAPMPHFSEWSIGYLYSRVRRAWMSALDSLQQKEFVSSRMLSDAMKAKRRPHLVGVFRK